MKDLLEEVVDKIDEIVLILRNQEDSLEVSEIIEITEEYRTEVESHLQ